MINITIYIAIVLVLSGCAAKSSNGKAADIKAYNDAVGGKPMGIPIEGSPDKN